MAWHKKVMKQKYNDPDKLKEYLDAVYGPGNWRVEVKSNNRWMIGLTRPWQEVSKKVSSFKCANNRLTQISKHEMENIESQVRVHYDPTYYYNIMPE
ncbi:hypothetical protein MFIFM68171_04816 [Madurella fahalii]|uniref:Uncharacterized protein n=1 Tax=Madurella fahalii TaxID=1157608 RepID=A0ABQ0GA56_9PEZI